MGQFQTPRGKSEGQLLLGVVLCLAVLATAYPANTQCRIVTYPLGGVAQVSHALVLFGTIVNTKTESPPAESSYHWEHYALVTIKVAEVLVGKADSTVSAVTHNCVYTDEDGKRITQYSTGSDSPWCYPGDTALFVLDKPRRWGTSAMPDSVFRISQLILLYDFTGSGQPFEKGTIITRNKSSLGPGFSFQGPECDPAGEYETPKTGLLTVTADSLRHSVRIAYGRDD